MRVTLNKESQAIWQAQNLEHLRYEYVLEPDDVVIDLGAYCGEWASSVFSRYGCRLVCVEPGPWIVGFPYGDVINKAAATYNGTMSFGGAYYYTSAHEPQTHEYPCFDVNELLCEYDEIALLKLNIEGGEYVLLNHVIDANCHLRIRDLQVQFHLIEGKPIEEMYGAIADKLTLSHRLTWRYPFCWENWERC